MSHREIKFRWWNTALSKMFGPESIFQLTDASDEQVWGSSFNSDHVVFMQFTGLLDKEGRDIFEGDIVEAKNWNPMRYTVEFIEGGFCFTHPKLKGSPIDINLMFSSQGCACAVIGNIHENPELLP
jgi:uncharacterized phage protein (TIGR01671 family)